MGASWIGRSRRHFFRSPHFARSPGARYKTLHQPRAFLIRCDLTATTEYARVWRLHLPRRLRQAPNRPSRTLRRVADETAQSRHLRQFLPSAPDRKTRNIWMLLTAGTTARIRGSDSRKATVTVHVLPATMDVAGFNSSMAARVHADGADARSTRVRSRRWRMCLSKASGSSRPRLRVGFSPSIPDNS